jgi:hypothetical protein
VAYPMPCAIWSNTAWPGSFGRRRRRWCGIVGGRRCVGAMAPAEWRARQARLVLLHRRHLAARSPACGTTPTAPSPRGRFRNRLFSLACSRLSRSYSSSSASRGVMSPRQAPRRLCRTRRQLLEPADGVDVVDFQRPPATGL